MPQNKFEPNPELKVFIDGELKPVAEAKVCVFDHGLLYGDGVFEGIRVYNGKIFEEQEHIKRFYQSSSAICLEVPMGPEELSRRMYETLGANNIVDGYIRLVITRGVGNLGINPKQTDCPNVIIIASTIALYPPDRYEKGLKAITACTIRNHPNSLSPRIKSLNYLNNIIAKLEAIHAGKDECIMLNHEGYVAEGTGDNLFAIRNGRMFTPPPSAGILEGITRNLVIRLARRRGIEVTEHNLIRYDLWVADEVFLTGTAAEVISVTEIDHRPIGEGTRGPITKMLKEDFEAYIRGEIKLE